MATWAQEAGFPVHSEDEFLGALEQDANALATKQDTRNRVRVDYELQDCDFAYPEEECYSRPDENGLCPDCAAWAGNTIRELLTRKEQERQCLRFFETMRGRT